MLAFLSDKLINLGLMPEQAILSASVISFVCVLLFAWIAYLITIKIILRYLKKIINLTKTKWDDILFENMVFNRTAHFIPAIIIYYGAALSLSEFPSAVLLIETATYLYMVIIGLMVTNSVLNGLHTIYNTMPVSKDRPVKGLIQVIKIFVYILGFGFIVSVILHKDLTSFFAGLGAMAAVIMLIFKDTILGFVAGIQLSANDMVRLGDWVEMPGRKADGTVIDISLNTVKIQNWDRTISTIPPYALITESFTNWRGMEDSGGRRIKRSINIDLKSIHFLNKEEIEKLKKIQIIRDYLEKREIEIEEYNKNNGIDESMPVNGRRLTNIGTFRKYVEEYLKRNPNIHQNMTFLVRQLPPTDKGLPIEIYVFSKDQRWAYYEGIQADIFDHILAIVPQFNLSIYQNPSGDDITRFLELKENSTAH
jgi:miniconductance mechanosensitive channel